MTGPDRAIHYVHFPKLVVPAKGAEMLGGRLEPFAFGEFEELDGDWAKANYFDETKPTVWKYADDSAADGDHSEAADLRISEQATLIYYALLVEGSGLLPDPRMSVRYLRRGTATSRSLGPYERTFLLNGEKLPKLSTATLRLVAERAERWSANRLTCSARIFGPLRGLALLGSGALAPPLAVVPLVVSLEGYLLGRKVTGGIAAGMTRQLNALGVSLPGLAEQVRRLYAWRSDIVHGRQAEDSDIQELLGWLAQITRAVVRQGAELAIGHDSNGNDLSIVRLKG